MPRPGAAGPVSRAARPGAAGPVSRAALSGAAVTGAALPGVPVARTGRTGRTRPRRSGRARAVVLLAGILLTGVLLAGTVAAGPVVVPALARCMLCHHPPTGIAVIPAQPYPSRRACAQRPASPAG